jgi:hypothetical protein
MNANERRSEGHELHEFSRKELLTDFMDLQVAAALRLARICHRWTQMNTDERRSEGHELHEFSRRELLTAARLASFRRGFDEYAQMFAALRLAGVCHGWTQMNADQWPRITRIFTKRNCSEISWIAQMLHCVCNQYSGANSFNNRVHFFIKCKILFFRDCGSTVNLQAYQQTGSFQDKSERVMSP